MPKTTEWTDSNHRIHAEVAPNGTFILSCESQVLIGKTGEIRRTVWLVSQLGLPVGTRRAEAERQAAHWLAFFADTKLAELGLSAFREVFDAVEENQQPVPPSGGQGMVH